MESRNPGLEFRTHWITKAAYGRDQEYQPYFNNAVDSNQDINYVYFYPGTMPAGSAVNQYYVPGNVKALMNMDGVTVNTYGAITNPYPYTLADQYNHAMSWKDEYDLYQNRLAAGNEIQGTLTYRLLLDDLIANPDNYRNAIFINLHGELIPMPSIRNYSDAAKDPATYPQWRVVTHPEKIRFGLAEDVKLRVYSYLADPSIGGNDYMDVPISVVLEDMDLTQGVGDVIISAIEGGTDQDPVDASADTYAVVSPAPDASGGDPWMYATVAYDGVNNRTIIRLYNTPLRTPETADNRGLDTSRRLYGMDYIPCPVSSTAFSQILTSTLQDNPKNTARWVITIPQAVLDREGVGFGGPVAFETRIDDDLTTGTMWPVRNNPANLSRTFIWRSDDPNIIPFSERYQFQGDPRHCPYADVRNYHGYNWYFDNLRDSSANVNTEWPGIDGNRINNGSNSIDGWHGGGGTSGDMMEIDVPRYFQFIRTALTNANGVYTSITGFSYYYMGVGNEIGYDSSNGFANSIPVSAKPFTGGSGSRNEDCITTAQSGGVKYIRENVSPYWWGMPWIGELYPDNVYATQWAVNGNLNTGSGANTFVRIRRRDMTPSNLPRGTTFSGLDCVRRTNAYGCTSFFNIGTSGSTFRHNYRDGSTGDIDTPGQDMATNFSFPLPDTADMSRPFRLANDWGSVPTEFNHADYSGIRCSSALLARFYDHQDGGSWQGSSLVTLQNPAGSNAFIVVNGLDRTVETGTAFIARYSILSLINSLLTCGRADLGLGTNRIVQLPRLEILDPNVTTELNNPVNIPLTWSIEWKRWDTQKYTNDYPDGFAEIEGDLRYTLLYSRDNGQTWLHIVNDSAATAGYPNQGLWLADANDGGNENYNWDVSNTGYFVEGSYIIMIEAYRNNQPCHYAYHQQKVYLNR